MLEKQAERIIRESGKMAGIITPETDFTAAEIEDAMYNLNCLLQSMNNDGFRLFTMSDGYMPLLPKKNEYGLATEAYKSVQRAKIKSIDNVGALRVELSDLTGISVGQTIRFQNNTMSSTNTVAAVDYENKTVELENPLNMSVYQGDTVYYGLFSMADAVMVSLDTSFSTLTLDTYETVPMAGQNIMFKFGAGWVRATVSSFDADTNVVSFTPAMPAGAISARAVLFGQNINVAQVSNNAVIGPRAITFLDSISCSPKVLGVLSQNSSMYDIMRVSGNVVFLENVLPESLVTEVSDAYLYADRAIEAKTIAEIGAFSNLENPIILSFAISPSLQLALVEDEYEQKYLYCRPANGGSWALYDLSNISGELSGLYVAEDKALLMTTAGLYDVSANTSSTLLSDIDVEAIVKFAGAYYVISTKEGGSAARQIVKTVDMANFDEPYSTLGLESVKNPAEFNGKLYIGRTTTTVTTDMVHFEQIPAYAENRCVVGDKMINMNSSQVCTWTGDGVNFEQLPFRESNQTACGYKNGCSVVAIVDTPSIEQEPYCTQVFMTNGQDLDWALKAVVDGVVSAIWFVGNKMYAVSNTEVKEIKITLDNAAHEDVYALLCGEPIGRPQQILNVVKYGFGNQTQLPMDAIPVKEYENLPHRGADGEPVTYCFLREAKDGKMFVWGTPTKFGEYLKFTYVRTLRLLDGVRDIPDFPDEYMAAVIDAFAVELGHQYKIPSNRIQELEAKAAKSMENALLHDNEDTSYRIGITPRGY